MQVRVYLLPRSGRLISEVSIGRQAACTARVPVNLATLCGRLLAVSTDTQAMRFRFLSTAVIRVRLISINGHVPEVAFLCTENGIFCDTPA